MYRIELTPGEEALFKSLDELAIGVQSGIVGPHARIWHAASNKWLPIDFHPHYKLAREKQVTVPKPGPVPAAPAAVKPVFGVPVAQPAPAVVPPVAVQPAPAPAAVTEPDVDDADTLEREVPAAHGLVFLDVPGTAAVSVASSLRVDYAGEAEPVHLDFGHADEGEPVTFAAPSRLSGRRRILLAGAAVAVVVIGSAAYALGSKDRDAGIVPRELAVASAQLAAQPPSPTFESIAAENVPAVPAARMPVDSAARQRTRDSMAVIPVAPAFSMSNASMGLSVPEIGGRSTIVVTPAALAANYHAAHDAARSGLESRLRVAGIVNLFAASRLSTGNVGSARLALAGATTLIRNFQKRGAAIEKAYRDSAHMLGKLGWTSAQRANWESRADRGERSAPATDALLNDVEGLFAVLGEHEGGYDITDGTITFRDSEGAREYGSVRRRLAGRIENSDSGSASVAILLRAIGTTRLPEERVGD